MGVDNRVLRAFPKLLPTQPSLEKREGCASLLDYEENKNINCFSNRIFIDLYFGNKQKKNYKKINIYKNWRPKMKKLNLFFIICIIVINLFSCKNVFTQKISRGPDIGEIYFLGPTHTGTGLYYSTNFGESAICVDSVNFITSIAADKTVGGVYSVSMPASLYYSNNYGYANSWVLRTGELDDNIRSGVSKGYIFSGCVLHSEDYGVNFFYHSLNGFFGNPKNNAIDNVDDNIGYVITNKLTVADTLYLFRTIDKFENLELIHKLNNHWSDAIKLSRGFLPGEFFFFNHTRNELWFSNNYADGLELLSKYNFCNYYQISSEGGKQEGEFFILYNFVNLMWQNAHIYIYHSTDYGITFEVFHPFSKGNEPVLANFSTVTQEGNQPLEVEFCNYSIGEILEYQWDFENDGIIDSYEQSPIFTYQNTGNYSVKLTVVGSDSTNSFLKEDYITVSPGNSQAVNLNSGYQFISANRSPENPDMLEVLENNLNDKLDFVRNSQGQMLQNIGGNWVNGIGDWISTEGYLFKMMEPDILIIDGTLVNPQTPIELNTGYQFISYLPNETLDALEAFAGILNDDLDFIRNSEGGVLRKIGPNWVNGIGECNQGEGFLVKMNGEGVLVYP